MVDVDKVLIGKKDTNSRALFAIISNGGQIQVGNVILEVIATSTTQRIIQTYQVAMDARPIKQNWVKCASKPPVANKPKTTTLNSVFSDETMEI